MARSIAAKPKDLGCYGPLYAAASAAFCVRIITFCSATISSIYGHTTQHPASSAGQSHVAALYLSPAAGRGGEVEG